jgi:hypothetical protein
VAGRLGSLTGDLHMETAAFLRDMRRVGQAVATETARMRQSMRALETASARAQRSFSQLRSGIAAMAGALAVRQFVTWAGDALRFADEIQNVADVTGLTTDQLQALQAAGNLVGLGVEKTNRGLAFFTKTLGQARAGTGPLVAGLKGTNRGLLDQLRASKGTADALEIYLKHLSGITDESIVGRFAVAGFGREGLRFAGIARESGGSLAALIERFREYLILSPQLVAAGDRIGDNLGQLSQAFQVGFARGIITELSQFLNITKEQFQSAADVGQRFGQAVGQALTLMAQAAEFVARNMREIVTAIAVLAAMKMAAMFYSAGLAMVGLARAAVLTAKAVISIGTAIKTLPAGRLLAIGAGLAASALAVVGLEKATTDLTPELNSLTESIGKLNLNAPPAVEGTEGLADAFNKGSAAGGKYSQALSGVSAQLDAINQKTIAASQLQAANSAVKGYVEAIGPLQQYQLEIQRLNELQAQGAITAAQFGQAQVMAAASALQPWLQVVGNIGSALGGIFEQNKAVAIAQAIINTLQGITAILAQHGTTPIGLALAASTAAMGFAQVAKIQSTEPGGGGGGKGAGGGKGGKGANGFALGGRVPGSGLGDIVPALLTPGEHVIKKREAIRFRPLLEEINSGSVEPLKKMALGGIVPGRGIGDKVQALLEPQEFVSNRNAARRFRPLLEEINSSPSRFAAGGSVGGGSSMAGGLGGVLNVNFQREVVTDDISASRFARRLYDELDRQNKRRFGRRAFRR